MKIIRMNKIKYIFFSAISLIMLYSLSACASKTFYTTDTSSTFPSEDTTPTTDSIGKENMKSLELKIDNTIVTVTWEDNAPVNALKELAKDGLTINMHEYGGFEQTGMLGSTITSNDSRIDVVPGDIVLYNSNQISIFYNNSSWSYTKLGHINISKSELTALLSIDAVIVTFTLR